MAEDNEMKQKADKLFMHMSVKDMSAEDKAGAAAIIKENPEILTDPNFVAKIAPEDMNLCPKEGYADFVAKASRQTDATTHVLDNLRNMSSENLLDNYKDGKTPVQHLLDEAQLPNGETIGSQTVKNVMFIRALRGDEQYPDKTGMEELHDKNMALLRNTYDKDVYGANPNAINMQGQKVGDLMKGHMEERKTLSVEELRTKAYQGTLTVEQMQQLKKTEDKKVDDVYENNGDINREKTERDHDRFKDGDVVKYMYEEWFLAGASSLFNWAEDKALALIDASCNVFVESAAKRKDLKSRIKDQDLRQSHQQCDSFAAVYQGVLNAHHDIYAKKQDTFGKMFEDLRKTVNDPNHQSQYEYDPKFIEKLKAEPAKANAFLDVAPKNLEQQLKFLEATDKLALNMAQVEMLDEHMRSKKAWEKGNEPKTNDELKQDLEVRAAKKQKKLIEAVQVIAEDTRLIAEIAFEGATTKLSKDEFIQAQVNAEVNRFIVETTSQVDKASKIQQKEIDEDKFAERGKEKPSNHVANIINTVENNIDSVVSKGKIYRHGEFSAEKSKDRIEAGRSLMEEARYQNTPSVVEKCQKSFQAEMASLEARKQIKDDRKVQLDKMKARLEKRDGSEKLDARIADYQKGSSGRQ